MTLPPPLEVLDAQLAGIRVLAEQGTFAGLPARVTALEGRVRHAAAAAQRIEAAATSLLAERGELRGRLEAYQVKAAARRPAQAQPLERLGRQGHDLLFRTPCDLDAARNAVAAYARALNAVPGTPEGEQT